MFIACTCLPLVQTIFHYFYLLKAKSFCRFFAQILCIPAKLLIARFACNRYLQLIISNSYCSVVKEEISDEEMNLPCFNGRVVAWVSRLSLNFFKKHNLPMDYRSKPAKRASVLTYFRSREHNLS